MKRYRLAIEAEKDLENVFIYTIEKWGANQAYVYYQQIIEIFNSLLNQENLGSNADYVIKGLRKIKVGKHFVYYIKSSDEILIIRILHQNMDVEENFEI